MAKQAFNKNMSSADFKRKYWYKADLESICRELGLPTYGTKYELTNYIFKYLNGTKVADIKPVRKNHRKNISVDEITVDTPILASGFSLNAAARQFFCNYYQVDKFSFTKPMAIEMRRIEAEQDLKATVDDLIKAYEGGTAKVPRENREEGTYQWNNFVRDFNADPKSNHFKNHTKVTSVLWRKVRDSAYEKKYDSMLLEKYWMEVEIYLS